MSDNKPSGSFVLWDNTMCNPLAPARDQAHSAWHDGYESGKAEEHMAFLDLQKKYFDLCDVHARSLNQAIAHGKWDADAKILSFKERLAEAIEDMPFGDTSASFAVFVRGFE